MKIRMLTGVAGTRDNGEVFSVSPGEEADFDTDTAKRYLESGQAEVVAAKPVSKAEKRTSTRAATAETR